jgi:hypothetical protein
VTKRFFGAAALMLLAACGSDDPTEPTTPPPPAAPVPNLTGTYASSQMWLTQFTRTRDGYNGSWTCSGSLTITQPQGSANFTGFAVVGSPCPANSFELTGTSEASGGVTFTTRGPKPGAGTCPLPPTSSYTGLFLNRQLSARTSVKIECPGDLEGEYQFNYLISAFKNS